MELNSTDRRIVAIFDKSHGNITPERIARRIGRPNDVGRVIQTLERTGRLKNENN